MYHPDHVPLLVLFAIGANRIFFEGWLRARKAVERALWIRRWGEVLVALLLSFRVILTQPSIVPYWDISTRFFSRWHLYLLPNIDRQKMSVRSSDVSIRTAFLNGPLGLGASKVVRVLVACILWRILNKEWPQLKLFGDSYPGLLEWGVLTGISLTVNLVLKVWSRIVKSRGAHDGVRRMVTSSQHRSSLTPKQILVYGCLAFVNATCEEITFRWFWTEEFAVYLNGDKAYANLMQAALFGTSHYYGIPSGLSGVVLTFCYGYIMGILKDWIGGGGLFLPIVTHTIADYYLFSQVARGKTGNDKRSERSSPNND